ncbi:hypothetical protein CTAYLR_002501 [Chrysophaeum taylorii]|uniref:Maf-like protein n=1 Tax=Chrysophaeum taylorii TaxID=2483200 RepID=A0AAD7XMH2_9STRA|nr:hypothetical protein CTAYLR_002501 [Chrysophaeum taylorii]
MVLALAMVVSLETALESVARMPPNAPAFILGSSSSSRRALLGATGASFETMVPDIDEKAIGDREGDPETLVRLVATSKADALVSKLPADSRVLLTGDQVVVFEGTIREKPVDVDECRAFISSYGRCTTVGAVCLHALDTGKRVIGVHEASVTFDPIPDTVVDALIKDHADAMLQCAGGLMVEHPLLQPFVTEVSGGLDSIMGLSTHLVLRLLDDLAA